MEESKAVEKTAMGKSGNHRLDPVPREHSVDDSSAASRFQLEWNGAGEGEAEAIPEPAKSGTQTRPEVAPS